MADAKTEWLSTFKNVVGADQAVGQYLHKAVEDLNPLKVLELFKRVTAEVSSVTLCSYGTDLSRTLSCCPCTPRLVDQKIMFGSISRFRHLASDLR
jgi:hypothetical protein